MIHTLILIMIVHESKALMSSLEYETNPTLKWTPVFKNKLKLVTVLLLHPAFLISKRLNKNLMNLIQNLITLLN